MVRRVSRLQHSVHAANWGWALLLPAGLGLAAAAGTVSHGGPVESTGSDVIQAATIGALTALAVGLLAVRLLRRQPALRVLGIPTALAVIVACGALLGVTTATSAATVRPADPTAVDGTPPQVGVGGTAGAGTSPGSARDSNQGDITDVQGLVVLLTGLVMLVAAAMYLMRQSELRAEQRSAVYLRSDLALEQQPHEAIADETALSEALIRSLSQLSAESDPRIAIRAAYGSLLNELSAIGLPRHRYEGPAEHIGRCLTAAPLPTDAITELLHLFEIARFSEHPITSLHADRARFALTASIDSLTGVTT